MAEVSQANSAAANSAQIGKWSPVFPLPNVAVHASVLANGLVLFWGRRDNPTDSLDVHECTPQLWDPATGMFRATPQPTLPDGTRVNLFCSGHTFLPDGRLLAVGGHLADSNGVNQSAIYDPDSNTWSPSGLMNEGRWYPTALSLSDGTVLTSAGSFFATPGNAVINDVQQIWQDFGEGEWRSIVNFIGLPLFPRMHLAPDGRVFMSGALSQSYFLDTKDGGTWQPLSGPGASRSAGAREYATSVMYDVGKILFAGGGNDDSTGAPTPIAERIDLTSDQPQWQSAGTMLFARRQHNATILPDGSVLVTGGTSGPGFNDLTPGAPVHQAEIWDPNTDRWTLVAAEDVDRCYHSTAVLLADGRVLSAGGGEYRPVNGGPDNAPKDSHRDAQIFSPPYLFRGARPDITSDVSTIFHSQEFEVATPTPNEITRLSIVRLSSVTHSNNFNQQIAFLNFRPNAKSLTVSGPSNPASCPPGHYWLFALNSAGVPSVGRRIRIAAPATAAASPAPRRTLTLSVASATPMATITRAEELTKSPPGRHVVVGITPTCPYGISACWGGAYEGLNRLQGIVAVRPIPDARDSTAVVYLGDDSLPDVEQWPAQFTATTRGSYVFRGVEVCLSGTARLKGGNMFLTPTNSSAEVRLIAMRPSDKLQWDNTKSAPIPLNATERQAFAQLDEMARNHGSEAFQITVTGPLTQKLGAYALAVRKVHQPPPVTA